MLSNLLFLLDGLLLSLSSNGLLCLRSSILLDWEKRLVSVVSAIGLIFTVVDSGWLVMLWRLMEQRNDFDLVIFVILEERELVDSLMLMMASHLTFMHRDLVLGSSPVPIAEMFFLTCLMSIAIMETVIQ